MQGLLSICSSLLPSAVDAQRRASKTVFTAVSTGSTLQRESMTVARAVSHLPINAVEHTTGGDVTDAHRTVDARFEAVQAVSDGAEDRFLTAMLSSSQVTAEYARLVDGSIERVCPASRDVPD